MCIRDSPRYRERRFVLQPLLDIFVDGRAFGMEFASCLDKIDGQAVEKIPTQPNWNF